jgi:hypothetical protein
MSPFADNKALMAGANGHSANSYRDTGHLNRALSLLDTPPGFKLGCGALPQKID